MMASISVCFVLFGPVHMQRNGPSFAHDVRLRERETEGTYLQGRNLSHGSSNSYVAQQSDQQMSAQASGARDEAQACS